MLGRGFTVGSNEVTAPVIEASFIDFIILLDAHLGADRPFIMGSSPCMADFGLSGQLYQMLTDTTAGEMMRLHAPNVALWAERMLNPCAVLGGEFEEWDSLASTLEPILSNQVSMFLAWSAANAKALAAGDKELSMQLPDGRPWKQIIGGPQKYHGKSLAEIRRKFGLVAGDKQLTDILANCGCLSVLEDAGNNGAKL
jgi:hypothetical protein